MTENYALCPLTRDSDRLMALAGTARAVADHRQKSRNADASHVAGYLAGLWKEELPEGLIWVLWPEGGDQCTRAKQYRGECISQVV